MTTDIAALRVGLTVGEAVERILQLQDDYEDLLYVYVVDDNHRLLGVFSFMPCLRASYRIGLHGSRDVCICRIGGACHNLEDRPISNLHARRPNMSSGDGARL